MFKLQETVLFVTSCFSTYLNTIDNASIIGGVNQLQLNESSVSKSNEGGYQSPVLSKYDNDATEHLFKTCIIPAVEQISKVWSTPCNTDNFSFWYNVNYKYSFNREHIHQNSCISGVYYVKVPSNSGNIVFLRAQSEYDRMTYISNKLQEANVNPDNNRINSEYWFVPEEGLLLLFPSHLTHYVKQNLTTDEDDRRISIAFNFY